MLIRGTFFKKGSQNYGIVIGRGVQGGVDRLFWNGCSSETATDKLISG